MKTYIPAIDWMKVIAMYGIVSIHCTVPGGRFLLSCVPIFFILSGFLFRKKSWRDFIKSDTYNLIIPAIILFFFDLFEQAFTCIVKGNELNTLTFAIDLPVRGILGWGHSDSYRVLGPLWFVYSLILCRFLLQSLLHLKERLLPIILICISFLIFCVIFNHSEWGRGGDNVICNAALNTLLAFPFFCIGYVFSLIKESATPHSTVGVVSVMLVSAGLFCLSAHLNGWVNFYRFWYGKSILLCLIQGVSGTTAICGLSFFLQRMFRNLSSIVRILGGGTLMILGLHSTIIDLLREGNILQGAHFYNYAFSLLIMISFIPINYFIKRYFPLLWGKYRTSAATRG